MAIDNAKILSIVKRKPQIRILSDEEVEWFISSAIRKYISTKYPFSSTFKDVDELVGNEIKILENWVISATIAMIESMGNWNYPILFREWIERQVCNDD